MSIRSVNRGIGGLRQGDSCCSHLRDCLSKQSEGAVFSENYT